MKKILGIMCCLLLVICFASGRAEAIILAPVVDGTIFDFNDDNVSDFVNGAGGVQAVDMINFDSRGIIEFNLSGISGPVSNSFLRLYKNAAFGPFPMTIDVYGYSADGILSDTDYNAGSFLTSFD